MLTERQLISSRSTSASGGAALAPAPTRRVEATAPTRPERAAGLRHLAAAQFAAWGLADDDRDAALLIAGELLANAVQHGRSSMTLTLALHPQVLHISVADHGPGRRVRDGGGTGQPAPAPAPAPDEHGRGLAIVAALAAWVEVVHDDNGHRVWAAVGITPG